MTKPILLVEDSRRDAMALEELIRSVGVTNPIIPLRDGRETLSYLAGKGAFKDRELHPIPGIMLLDLRMPDVDGFDVLEWMHQRSEFEQMLVIVLSAYDGLREVKQAYSLGAKSFLVKPCNAADIRNVIESFPQHWSLSTDPKPIPNDTPGIPDRSDESRSC